MELNMENKGSGTQDAIQRRSAIWGHHIGCDIFVSDTVYWFLSREQVMLLFIVILIFLLQYSNFTWK